MALGSLECLAAVETEDAPQRGREKPVLGLIQILGWATMPYFVLARALG